MIMLTSRPCCSHGVKISQCSDIWLLGGVEHVPADFVDFRHQLLQSERVLLVVGECSRSGRLLLRLWCGIGGHLIISALCHSLLVVVRWLVVILSLVSSKRSSGIILALKTTNPRLLLKALSLVLALNRKLVNTLVLRLLLG